ncbi:MAG TPA: hypothetical protein VFD82_21400 [Planctomycetota bacterium]|nr:hypothetical protein [Planctomycetota bacterium]
MTVAPGRQPLVCAAAMFAVALLWFWPTLQHGLRNDDYLTVYYTDRTTGAVSWGRVFEEFVRPWFGGSGLYRPLVSLSFGIEFACCPAGPCHLTNVVMLGITAAATAATAARLAPMRPRAAAIVAGLVVVLHPAAVEPTAWICARTTGMQVAAGAVACWLFASHLDQQRRLWPSIVAAAAALGCKEGAVMLPVSLLAIDLLHSPRRPWSQRLGLHAPFAVVLALYFGLRLLLLGHLGATGTVSSADNLHNAGILIEQLFLPPDGDGHRRFWAVPLLALALRPLLHRHGLLSLGLPLWLLLLLAPNSLVATNADVMYGRLVFDAVPPLALALGLSAATPSSRLAFGAIAALTAGVLTALALTSSQWLGRYGTEDRVARGVARAVVTAAADATAAKPFAITGLPYLPLFHQKLWGVLGLAPFAPRDLAVIGLPEFLVADEKAPEFFNDAAPLHAIHSAGGTVAILNGESMSFVPLPRPTLPSAQLERTAAAPRDFVAAGPWSGSCVAAIEVRLPSPANNVRLRLLDDLPDERAFGWHSAPAPAATAWFDTTHAMAPVMLQAFGIPFRGVHVEVDGAEAAAGTVVVVHAMLSMRALPERNAGKPWPRAAMLAVAQKPPAAQPLRLYLMLPTGVRHMDGPASGADLSAALQDHLRFALDIYGPLTVHWFWQTPPGFPGPPWCSELDWAVVDRDVAR